MKLPKFKVAILCMTYQHAPYIKDALDGFCMQLTNFPFIAAVVDDASTDGEQQVINQYLKDYFNIKGQDAYFEEKDEGYYTYAQHKTNKNCYILSLNLKKNLFQQKGAKSKLIAPWIDNVTYSAECEGDDYWTDPLKLHRQVDFMDSHPEYVFCCHRFVIYEQNTHQYRHEYAQAFYQDGQDLEITHDLFLKTWVTMTLTGLFRQSIVKKAATLCLERYHDARDVYLFYELLQLGKGISMNQYMGVYRWHDGGIAIGQDSVTRYKKSIEIYSNIYRHHPEDKLLLPKIRYNYDELLRYATISQEGRSLLKESFLYCETFSQKLRIMAMYLIPPTFFVIPNKIFKFYLRKKCSISNPS